MSLLAVLLDVTQETKTNVLVFSACPLDGSEWSDSLMGRLTALTVPWERLPTAIDWEAWNIPDDPRADVGTDSLPFTLLTPYDECIPLNLF